MTLSMPDPSISWDRTLPKPTALLSHIPSDPFTHNRSVSWLHQHIASTRPSSPFETSRRNTLPDVAHLQRPSSPELLDPARISPGLVADGSNPADILSRKRSLSRMADESHSSENSPTSSSPSATDSANQFCLCQSESKIPRPRNAFILYRQHNQAAVVAQHPGLPNPDISKIIGEQWRNLPLKAKNEWKALAEEEKARHQQRYPEYRYQPRRNGRGSYQASISAPANAPKTGPTGNCLKCGGKMINPPSTPLASFSPVTSSMPHMVQHPPRAYTITAPNPRLPGLQQVVSPSSAQFKRHADGTGQAPMDPRVQYATGQPQLPPPTPMMLDSPDAKRRRFNANGAYIPVGSTVYGEPVYQASPRGIAFTQVEAPRTTRVPPRTPFYHPISAPPQFQLQSMQPPHPAQGTRDPSLTLAPLKTSTGSLSSPPQSVSSKSHKPSLESTVHSLPLLNKLKIISQISPSLSTLYPVKKPFQPTAGIRGAIVAIEGLDLPAVSAMTHSLAEQLQKEGKFAVRIFGGPHPYVAGPGAGAMTTEQYLQDISEWHKISREMVNYITTQPPVSTRMDLDENRRPSTPKTAVRDAESLSGQSLVNYPLSAVDQEEPMSGVIPTGGPFGQWTRPHREAQEPLSAVSPKTITQTAGLSLVSPMSAALDQSTTDPTTSTTPTPTRRASSTNTAELRPTVNNNNNNNNNKATNSSNSTPRPVAIIPAYSLTTVDLTSLSLPVTDSYSPLSHWQWLAALWRGCIGPDVSILITTGSRTSVVHEDMHDYTPRTAGRTSSSITNQHAENSSSSADHHRTSSTVNSNQNLHAPTTSTNKNTYGTTVEVRLTDHHAVVVTLDPTPPRNETERLTRDENWDKAKRRVGFEVEEYLRK